MVHYHNSGVPGAEDYPVTPHQELMLRIKPQVKAAPYNWPCTSRFSPENTALVIIDMQNDCTPPYSPT